MTVTEGTLSDDDERHLRAAIALSARTGRAGNRPFGSVIVDADGEVIAEGMNDTAVSGDYTGHAEMRALQAAFRVADRDRLSRATIYASGEPCVMCAGAIHWANLRRVVFGIDAAAMRAFRARHAGAGDIELSCRDIFAAAPQPIETIGPALADEAAVAHHDYWK